MGQFMAQDDDRISGIAAGAAALKHQALLVGNRDGGAPLRRVRPDPLPKTLGIRGHRDEDARPRTRQPGEGVVGLRGREQRAGQARITRVGDDRKTPRVETDARGRRRLRRQ